MSGDTDLFKNKNVNFNILKKRAYNLRWAEVPDGVIPLTAADIDFPVSEEITKALIDYIKPGYFSYTPTLGFPEFRREIAKYLQERGENIVSDNVLPVDSVARGMYIVAKAILKPGDEAIVFDPVDFLFKNSVSSAGAKPVYFPTKIIDGKIDFTNLEKYITPKTKMLCLCNPDNPLGLVYGDEELSIISSICNKYNLYIMNDEIWSDIVYGERPFKSILSVDDDLSKRIVSVNGFSKSYGLAGLRIGYIYTQDHQLFEKIVDASDVKTTAGGISSLSQVAGIAALSKAGKWKKEFIQFLKYNRDYCYKRLSKMKGISTIKPESTYVFWINIKELKVTSQQFVDFMKTKEKVALVPGSEEKFGPGAEGYVRLCFATSHEILAEGLNRIEKGLKILNKEK